MIYALLDSPRATGAYRFTVIRAATPPWTSSLKCSCATRWVNWAGTADQHVPVRAEPAVADAELSPSVARLNGLSIHAGNGEWIWRPLNNPKHLSVSTYTVENPKGFGLLQRGRNFKDYEDLDDRYDLRPSAGSNRRATGVKARSSWWRSRRRMKPTTISWRSGRRIRCRKPKAADAELPSELHPRRRQTAFARHRLCGADHAFDR